LSFLERALIGFVRRTFEPGLLSRAVTYCQRTVGCGWIHWCTKNLRHVHGYDRLPALDPAQSYILIANHRSFFDLYVVFGIWCTAGSSTASCSRFAPTFSMITR